MLRAAACRSWLAVIVVAVLATAGCGSSGEEDALSRASAQSLLSRLDRVEESVGAGACTAAREQSASFSAAVEALPGDTASDLREALASSAARLESLVAARCKAPSSQQDSVQPAPTGSPAAGDQGSQKKKDKGQKPDKQKKPKQNKDTPQEVPPNQGGTEPPADGQGGGSGTTDGGGQSGGAAL